jgi:hypothetical protein
MENIILVPFTRNVITGAVPEGEPRFATIEARANARPSNQPPCAVNSMFGYWFTNTTFDEVLNEETYWSLSVRTEPKKMKFIPLSATMMEPEDAPYTSSVVGLTKEFVYTDPAGISWDVYFVEALGDLYLKGTASHRSVVIWDFDVWSRHDMGGVYNGLRDACMAHVKANKLQGEINAVS